MSNAQIKLVHKLAQKKFRNESKLFVAEGLRLCEEVPPAQVEFEDGVDVKEVMGRVRENCKRVEKDCEIFL